MQPNPYLYLTADQLPADRVVCFICPHPDDASISAGGTLHLLSSRGNRVHVLVMVTGHHARIAGTTAQQRIAIREAEVRRECEILGAEPHFLQLPFYERRYPLLEDDLQSVRQRLTALGANWLFTPGGQDPHPTHALSRQLALLAAWSIEPAPLIWSYESPWGLFQNDGFNRIVPLSQETMAAKLRAIEAHASQTARTPYARLAEAIAALRAAIVPEQILAGLGETPTTRESYMEVFLEEPERHPRLFGSRE